MTPIDIKYVTITLLFWNTRECNDLDILFLEIYIWNVLLLFIGSWYIIYLTEQISLEIILNRFCDSVQLSIRSDKSQTKSRLSVI